MFSIKKSADAHRRITRARGLGRALGRGGPGGTDPARCLGSRGNNEDLPEPTRASAAGGDVQALRDTNEISIKTITYPPPPFQKNPLNQHLPRRPGGRTCARHKPASRSTAGSARKPEARTGRARARLFLPVLALLLAALSPFAVAPASAAVLVSNTGQTESTTVSTSSEVTAQGFTTGGSTGGYTLSNIEAVVGAANATQRATIRTELWSATSAGAPKAKLADLTVPSTVSAGTVSFAAPQGTMLSASTKYFLLFYTVGGFAWNVSMTASNSEDSSGQTDWSIEDGNRYTTGANSDTPTGATWAKDSTQNVRIVVNGSVNQATRSTNANLSGLTVGSSTSSGGMYTNFSFGTFSAETTTYAATVANDQTHVKLTPTVTDRGKATVAVRKGAGSFTTVTDRMASDPIALDVGANEITVRVTAEDTTTTKDYTVTVTRRVAPSSTPIWTGMLTVQDVSGDGGILGCANPSSGNECSSTSILDDDDFTLSGTTWEIVSITLTSTSLTPSFNRDVRTALDSYSFCVGTTAFAFSSAGHTDGNTFASMLSGGLSWTVGGTERVSIAGASCAQQSTQSTNADLSALTIGSSTSSGGQYTDFSIGTFGASTTSYTASVANTQTHVKVTPTVDDTGKATVTVNGTAVTDGTASDAIALDVGSNTITVQVTAEDESTTKDYTITVTRKPALMLPGPHRCGGRGRDRGDLRAAERGAVRRDHGGHPGRERHRDGECRLHALDEDADLRGRRHDQVPRLRRAEGRARRGGGGGLSEPGRGGRRALHAGRSGPDGDRAPRRRPWTSGRRR